MSSFSIDILDPSQLRAEPHLLSELRSMINESFAKHFSSSFPATYERLESNDAFAEELKDEGFAVLVYAPDPGNGTRQLVATMCARLHKYADSIGDEQSASEALQYTDSELAERNETHNDWMSWELKLAVVRYGDAYQKRGYVSHALQALEQDLKRRVRQHEAAGTSSGSKERAIQLTACVHKKVNGDYWQRRGFVTYKTLPCPKGTWGSLQDFDMLRMEKWLSLDEE